MEKHICFQLCSVRPKPGKEVYLAAEYESVIILKQ